MNTRIDNSDDAAEVQTVMSDYFAALLHESAESFAPAVVVEAVTIPAAEAETVKADTEQSAATPCYQLIRIGALTLGIPTQFIAAIVAAPTQWTTLDDARAWVLGSYNSRTESYTVVDTAALLIPGGALHAAAVGSSAVLLAGQRWALACDGIGEQIAPDPAQINWRGAQGKRLWLAGTVSNPACALLDIPELIGLLDTKLGR